MGWMDGREARREAYHVDFSPLQVQLALLCFQFQFLLLTRPSFPGLNNFAGDI
jgi:hypothetical protein